MVMVGHITVTAVDDEPATISHEVITGLLREELGWDGVVVTDSLDMGALAGYEIGEVCVKYLEAGGDIMLGIPDLAAAHAAGYDDLYALVGQEVRQEARPVARIGDGFLGRYHAAIGVVEVEVVAVSEMAGHRVSHSCNCDFHNSYVSLSLIFKSKSLVPLINTS